MMGPQHHTWVTRPVERPDAVLWQTCAICDAARYRRIGAKTWVYINHDGNERPRAPRCLASGIPVKAVGLRNKLADASNIPWKALLTLWFKADKELPERVVVGDWLDARMPREEVL